jgi:hypothetical protein
MRYLAAFVRFWYSFIVGDDWLAAVGVVVALGLTAAVAHRDVAAWWLTPIAVGAVLAGSVWRGARSSRRV